MGKTLFFVLATSFLLATFCSQAQRFFKIEEDMVDESTLRAGLDLMSLEYNQQIVTYKTFERVRSRDSIIENIAIVVLNEEEDEAVYRVFDFLDNPLPDFSFSDGSGLRISKKDFLGKYTVVGLYKDPAQMRNLQIKAMNDLVATGRYNAVSLIAKNGAKSITRKAEFPILNECIGWYIENISVPETPKFLVLDERGILRYIFQDFPDKRSTIRPIDPNNVAIFEILK